MNEQLKEQGTKGNQRIDVCTFFAFSQQYIIGPEMQWFLKTQNNKHTSKTRPTRSNTRWQTNRVVLIVNKISRKIDAKSLYLIRPHKKHNFDWIQMQCRNAECLSD